MFDRSSARVLLVAVATVVGIRAEQPAHQPPEQRAAGAVGRPYVTKTPPVGLTLATNLSAAERRENFEALWGIIDVNYAHFRIKAIDWKEVGRRYEARLAGVTNDEDFYFLMFQLVNELKDTHSWLENYKAPALAAVPGLPIDLFKGKPFVADGAKAGWEVLSVDGMRAAEKMESLRPRLRASSSERAFERQAGRLLLGGNEGETAAVELRSPDGRTETLAVRRSGRSFPPPARKLPANVTKQRFVHFGRLPSGLGYVWIESFNAREDVDSEFDRALEALRDTPGLVLDIRDNPGGFGHPKIVGHFLKKRTLVGFSYIKNGPGHEDFARLEEHLGQSGSWQYTRPVALLVNDVTGSASDLFAAELRSAGRVVTVGTATHGNLSGVAAYAVLPCGLVARISNGYVTDAKGRPIEVNGNVPDVPVEPDIQDYLNGRDPVLQRATEVILKNLGRGTTSS